MADLYPPDYNTELGQVRARSGDDEIDADGNYLISDEQITISLNDYLDKTSDLRIAYSTIDTLFLMKTKLAKTAMRVREREGGVEREFYGRERYDVICELYKSAKKDPSQVMKNPPAAQQVYLGGVSNAEVYRVRTNPDSNLPPCRVSSQEEDKKLIGG